MALERPDATIVALAPSVFTVDIESSAAASIRALSAICGLDRGSMPRCSYCEAWIARGRSLDGAAEPRRDKR